MEKMQQHDPIETNYEDHVPIMEHVEINHNVVTHKNPVLYPYKPSAPIDGQERRKGSSCVLEYWMNRLDRRLATRAPR